MGLNQFETNADANRQVTPIQWAERACATLMGKFAPEALPPEGRWHYHQGVFLLGMEKCWRETGDDKYYQYIKGYVDSQILSDGGIRQYHPDELDDIQPGILLFNLYEKTGDPRYKKALDTLVPLLLSWELNAEGGFWHKTRYPNQMWLDSIFMGGPIAVQYARRFNESVYYDLLVKQALLLEQHTKDPRTGLLFHGWDQSKAAVWADPETGCAPEIWGRALGWYPVALLEMLDFLPESHPGRDRLVEILRELLPAILRYQDETSGLWYQVIDKGDQPENWLETSCSCLFVYAVAKAVRMGFLDAGDLRYAWKGYQGIIDRLRFDDDGGLIIGDICIGTGIGDYPHYIARPRSANDLHGTGAFLFMCVEMSKAKQE